MTSRAGRVVSLLLVLASAGVSCSDAGGHAATLLVGAAKRDITPTPENAPPAGNVYLGGYGFGPVRLSTGVLAPIHVRAFVVSDGDETVAFAENETQGAFGAYKDGAFGAIDVARDIEAATGGAIAREHVIVGSAHSHSGPDTTGIWGGLPDSYLQYLESQTVGAILDAYAARKPARLATGTADATDLLHSQFDAPPNDQVDGELRVLVAEDPAQPAGAPGATRSILINFAAHGTVMGAGNLLLSSDWPGVVAGQVEQALGVDTAVVMVADVGRTQPNDSGVAGTTDPERLQSYSSAVTERVLAAAASTTPATGSKVDAAELFLRETYSNPFLPIALLGTAIARSNQPPWLDGAVVGTLVGAARIGDLFFAAAPGEAYPAIQFALEERVPSARHFIFGLANDQLGYLIAPEEGYAQVAAAAPGNDNALFNVSPTFGDHAMCTLFKVARRIGFTLPDDPAKCAAYANEDTSLPF
ncbi:MAG TPA: hypothetical protein VEI94_06895 [Candidatus Bathyarchaeia archaeon]|nr:hypothetical protein [Candidatus Bathyarchaeia archaeon]